MVSSLPRTSAHSTVPIPHAPAPRGLHEAGPTARCRDPFPDAEVDNFEPWSPRPWAAPPRHQWWTRRAALGVGAVCTAAGGMVLANASVLQTPMGAALLYAYETTQGPHAAQDSGTNTLHDWALAEALTVGAQAGGVACIVTGFALALYAMH